MNDNGSLITNPSVSFGTNGGATPPTMAPGIWDAGNETLQELPPEYTTSATSQSTGSEFLGLFASIGLSAFCILCLILIVRCCRTCCCNAVRDKALGRNPSASVAAETETKLQRVVPEGTNDPSSPHYPATYAATFAAAAASDAATSAVPPPAPDVAAISASPY